jgi:Cu-Zn family superoxide dismutase
MQRRHRPFRFLLCGAGALAAAALAGAAWGAASAHADLAAASGSQVRGTVKLTAVAGGVSLDARVSGLAPGLHGFHVHEVGDCSAADASSAKGHFNPTAKPHGAHAGDLPDLTADAAGVAVLKVDIAGMSLEDGPRGVLNRAFVVHADPDDHVSQPAGNSGKRIACGVIQAG